MRDVNYFHASAETPSLHKFLDYLEDGNIDATVGP